MSWCCWSYSAIVAVAAVGKGRNIGKAFFIVVILLAVWYYGVRKLNVFETIM